MRGERDALGGDEEAMLGGVEAVGLARDARRIVDDERATGLAHRGDLAHHADKILEAHRHRAVGELELEELGRQLDDLGLVRIRPQALDGVVDEQEAVVERSEVRPQAAQERRERRRRAERREEAVADVAREHELRSDRQQAREVR